MENASMFHFAPFHYTSHPSVQDPLLSIQNYAQPGTVPKKHPKSVPQSLPPNKPKTSLFSNQKKWRRASPGDARLQTPPAIVKKKVGMKGRVKITKTMKKCQAPGKVPKEQQKKNSKKVKPREKA
jgi:hypothetical protein